MTKIALLQLPTLALSEARLDYYLKHCKDSGAKLVVLGEYILNSFFKELENMPLSMIKKQSNERKNSLLNLSKKYDLTIVAPLILVKGKDIFKTIAKFTPLGARFHEQQILMPYSHWNEAKFYKNKLKKEKLEFLTFRHDGFKFGILFGYETHFDTCFTTLSKKNIDAIIVPTASTFQSHQRWTELLKMRAFTNSVYIIRANRIGSYKIKNETQEWEFYGDSMLISPLGEVSQKLSNQEEMMIANLSKKELAQARNLWGFKNISKNFA
ncbi:Deaminated glutathione amidase [Campylobacter majalis]|uniref:Deaminated glutathione amidase n=1 Tax=Campylobacter majalis TaxID=2790656 RepID=A0ABN7K537_9BACT|nr:carbon-nitrogen hydrolase family protein [Campylobacter majalis]CAD7287555.1 Deaminated glutathione amidase [Campylobacter majalis]